jgi:peroxiredoxin
MAIQIGDKVPNCTLKRLTPNGLEEVQTGSLFEGKKVVLFSLPGAYTPTCSATHLPGFVKDAEDIKKKGVGEIVCLSVNDPWVMKAWGDQHGAEGKVLMLPDGDGAFTRALGLEQDLGALLGKRGKRFMLIAENGVVTHLAIEEGKGVNVSGSDACQANL